MTGKAKVPHGKGVPHQVSAYVSHPIPVLMAQK